MAWSIRDTNGTETKRLYIPVTRGYPAIAAGPEASSVGNTNASILNNFKAPSIPRVWPKSLSAARASKYAWSTVVFSEAINLSVG